MNFHLIRPSRHVWFVANLPFCIVQLFYCTFPVCFPPFFLSYGVVRHTMSHVEAALRDKSLLIHSRNEADDLPWLELTSLLRECDLVEESSSVPILWRCEPIHFCALMLAKDIVALSRSYQMMGHSRSVI